MELGGASRDSSGLEMERKPEVPVSTRGEALLDISLLFLQLVMSDFIAICISLSFFFFFFLN